MQTIHPSMTVLWRPVAFPVALYMMRYYSPWWIERRIHWVPRWMAFYWPARRRFFKHVTIFFLPTESCNCAWSRSPCYTCIPLLSERLHVGIYFGYANVYLYDFSSQKHYELAHSGRVMKLYDRQFCTYGLPVAYAAGLGDEVQKIQTNIFSSLCAFNWHSLRCSPSRIRSWGGKMQFLAHIP